MDRLDVAMFNAILRESAEEIPTDPVSDPISDPRVLPILACRSSFGSGAQLKNAVSNTLVCLSIFSQRVLTVNLLMETTIVTCYISLFQYGGFRRK